MLKLLLFISFLLTIQSSLAASIPDQASLEGTEYDQYNQSLLEKRDAEPDNEGMELHYLMIEICQYCMNNNFQHKKFCSQCIEFKKYLKQIKLYNSNNYWLSRAG